MPRIDIDLGPFTSMRRDLAQAAAERRRLDAQAARVERALGAAQRRGEVGAAGMAAQLRELRQARAAVVERERGLKVRFDELADGALRERDPAQLVDSLDGGVPIALLPLRIETRYLDRDGERVLGVRIYPDDLHTIDHEPRPTPSELTAAQAVWRARFAADDATAARLLRDLTRVCGRGRAQWLVRASTPTNAPPAPGGEAAEPEFPAAETIDARARTTRAVLLPERFCAIGYAPDRQEVFRAWGATVPDELVLAPDWLASDAPEKLLAGDRAWMVNFGDALANGMAIEVRQRHVTGRFDLARDTVARLLVVGIEWTKGPEEAAADFASLLGSHRDATGLGFVPLGTPTNNTSAARAGTAPPAPASGTDALQLLHWAFGIAPELLPAEHIDNVHLAEQRTALHMLNALWRGTFGDYLLQMWNPTDPRTLEPALDTRTLYRLRRYAAAYLRPTGALPILRVHRQPYGLLPLVGRRYQDSGELAVETAVDRVLKVLRPMWERAVGDVPRLVDGDLERAQSILQTAPWAQAAYYRDKDFNVCLKPSPLTGAVAGARDPLVRSVLQALGPWEPWQVHIGVCNDFLPDPPYAAGHLAGVPWVLPDAAQPDKEAPAGTTFTSENNYLAQIAAASVRSPEFARATLEAAQNGPSLLQALAAYSVQKEQGDAADRFLSSSGVVQAVRSRALTTMAHIEVLPENEAFFTVHTQRELMGLQVPAVSGRATLGEHVAHTAAAQLPSLAQTAAEAAASRLFDDMGVMVEPTRDLGAVKLSLDWLSQRSVGELNIALRSTLDAFSHRLDAWLLARANRRLERMREAQPRGLHVGAYAFVENLSADTRPDSDGYLLCPSQGQAAAAALLRSGFLANQAHGAFDIALDSRRTSGAEDLLQGLARDQPLAALYGYRIERALRDAGRGRLIWPLRLAWPWHPGSAPASTGPLEAVGARDVVDGVALLTAWGANEVVGALNAQLAALTPPGAALSEDDLAELSKALDGAADLADSVSDLLLAEGAYQIARGNPERAAAAMAVADKQALPIETEVGRTPRGGASYTQRLVAVCPDAAPPWPSDRRAAAEPAVNRWLAAQLGDPVRYVFRARIHRRAADGQTVIDAAEPAVSAAALGLSPLSLVLMATGAAVPRPSGPGETGLRGAVSAALFAPLDDPQTVAAIEILPDSADAIGFAAFEAFATTLRALVDKARHATRNDLVVPDDELQAALPPQGDWAGVDVAELVGRADDAVRAFSAAKDQLLASADADGLLLALDGLADDLLPAVLWPAQVHAIDAPGADPATRDARAAEAVEALRKALESLQEELEAPPPLLDGQASPTPQQLAQHAVTRLKRLFGRDFPVLPRFVLGPYAAEFGAALGAQPALAAGDPWRFHGWLTTLARVREGADRLAGALSAHEALVAPLGADELKVVQFPHVDGAAWAALPEAWRERDGTPFDPRQEPEELHAWLSRPDAPRQRSVQRAAPTLAIVLHAPGFEAPAGDTPLAAFVCDDWPEFVPDPHQTAAIAFHHDAPGARPPQSVLLALPPRAGQPAWTFDDVVDVVHEAFDLARLRAVRPRDLGSGLGAVLPGNVLPANYTDELPSVRLLELMRQARERLVTAGVDATRTFPLGKL